MSRSVDYLPGLLVLLVNVLHAVTAIPVYQPPQPPYHHRYTQEFVNAGADPVPHPIENANSDAGPSPSASTPGNTSTQPGSVRIGHTTFVGNTTNPEVTFFGGIPYGQPPVGNLRFRAPKPALYVSSNGTLTRNAQDFGPACSQPDSTKNYTTVSGSEDCLALNIWTPPDALKKGKHAALPVYVFIHGGGYAAGATYGAPMDQWVQITNGSLIAVSLAYRLGSLGFLAPPIDIPSSGDTVTLNAGLLDQRLAIQWVHHNIDKFGGDPHRIVIGGQSAGGGSVAYHMAANGARNNTMWRGVIAESPVMELSQAPKDPVSQLRFRVFQAVTGCTNSTVEQTMECLRSLPPSAIAKGDAALITGITNTSALTFGPTIDGTYIPDSLSVLFQTGKFTPVPLLAGSVTADGIFQNASVKDEGTLRAALAAALPTLGNSTEAVLDRVEQLYPLGASITSQFGRAFWAIGDAFFTCAAERMLNTTLKRDVPTWRYRFATPDPTNKTMAVDRLFGGPVAIHSSENSFLYDGVDNGVQLDFNATEKALSRTLLKYFTSFVISLDPNAHKQASDPYWPGYNKDSNQSRLVITESQIVEKGASFVEQSPEVNEVRCGFWNEVASLLKN